MAAPLCLVELTPVIFPSSKAHLTCGSKSHTPRHRLSRRPERRDSGADIAPPDTGRSAGGQWLGQRFSFRAPVPRGQCNGAKLCGIMAVRHQENNTVKLSFSPSSGSRSNIHRLTLPRWNINRQIVGDQANTMPPPPPPWQSPPPSPPPPLEKFAALTIRVATSVCQAGAEVTTRW